VLSSYQCSLSPAAAAAAAISVRRADVVRAISHLNVTSIDSDLRPSFVTPAASLSAVAMAAGIVCAWSCD